LLELSGRPAGHFPQTATGEYAGCYPATGQEAVDQLEQLRASGFRFLLFPATALWWLEYYPDLAAHLERRYRRTWANLRCVIYDLSPERSGKGR